MWPSTTKEALFVALNAAATLAMFEFMPYCQPMQIADALGEEYRQADTQKQELCEELNQLVSTSVTCQLERFEILKRQLETMHGGFGCITVPVQSGASNVAAQQAAAQQVAALHAAAAAVSPTAGGRSSPSHGTSLARTTGAHAATGTAMWQSSTWSSPEQHTTAAFGETSRSATETAALVSAAAVAGGGGGEGRGSSSSGTNRREGTQPANVIRTPTARGQESLQRQAEQHYQAEDYYSEQALQAAPAKSTTGRAKYTSGGNSGRQAAQYDMSKQHDDEARQLQQAAAAEQQRLRDAAAAAKKLRQEAAVAAEQQRLKEEAAAEQQRLKESAVEQLRQAAAAQQLRQEALAQQQLQQQQQQQLAALEQQQKHSKAASEHSKQTAVAGQLRQQAAALQQLRQQAAGVDQQQQQQQQQLLQRVKSTSSPAKHRPLSPGQLHPLPGLKAAAAAPQMKKDLAVPPAKGPARTSSLTKLAEQLEAYAAAASSAICSRHAADNEDVERLQTTSSLTRTGAGVLAAGGTRPRQRLFSSASYPHTSGSRPPSGPGNLGSSQKAPRTSQGGGTAPKAAAAGIYTVPLKRQV